MRLPASFRDQSGFVFTENGEVFRQVNSVGSEGYESLMDTGLYDSLVEKGLLISHEEVEKSHFQKTDGCYKILKPRKIPFIVYPYELGFTQLKMAALLTLDIQLCALEKGMTLKDATAFNIQFFGSRPIFIDTLSFEKYRHGGPWNAYWQFTRHFLAPLLLMSKVHPSLHRFSMSFVDGIPLDVTSKMLPLRSKLSFGVITHVMLQSAAHSAKFRSSANSLGQRNIEKKNLTAMIEDLKACITGLSMKSSKSVWANYLNEFSYDSVSFKSKLQSVTLMMQSIGKVSTVLDLGSNVGHFSEIAGQFADYVIAVDSDFQSVENHFSSLASKRIEGILPIIADLVSPSPGIGWENLERTDLLTRLKDNDVVLALALVHHLVIANNIPMDFVAHLFSRIGKWLIVEYIPADDVQIAKMIGQRRGFIQNYSKEVFCASFLKHFEFIQESSIESSSRTLFLMKRKN